MSKMIVLKLKHNAEDLVDLVQHSPDVSSRQELFRRTNVDSTAVKMHSGYGQND